MKTVLQKGTIKNPVVHLKSTLGEKYRGKIIAPEKLEKLNKELSEKGFPPANFLPK